MLATIVIQPHVKGKVTPQKLLPFEWEKASKKKSHKPTDKKEDKARFEALIKGIGS